MVHCVCAAEPSGQLNEPKQRIVLSMMVFARAFDDRATSGIQQRASGGVVMISISRASMAGGDVTREGNNRIFLRVLSHNHNIFVIGIT